MENNTSQNMQGLWIDLDILRDSNLSLQEKFVLAIIKALDKHNGCFASNKYFAELLQVTSKRASDIIQSLISKKYITSTIEDHYKRTIKIAAQEQIEESVEGNSQEAPDNVIPFEKVKKKEPLMYRGVDLYTFDKETLERLKNRIPAVRELIEQAAYKLKLQEEPSEWQGINQLVLTT